MGSDGQHNDPSFVMIMHHRAFTPGIFTSLITHPSQLPMQHVGCAKTPFPADFFSTTLPR